MIVSCRPEVPDWIIAESEEIFMRTWLTLCLLSLACSLSALTSPDFALLRNTDAFYVPNGNNQVVVTSFAGRPIVPDWYYIIQNLNGPNAMILNNVNPGSTRPVFGPITNVYGWSTFHPSPIAASSSEDLHVYVVPMRPGAWVLGMSYGLNDPDYLAGFGWSISGTAQRPPNRAILVTQGGTAILDDSVNTVYSYPITTLNVGAIPKTPAERVFTYTLENIGTGPLTVSNVVFSSLTNCTARIITTMPQVINQDGTVDIDVAISGTTTGLPCSLQVQVFSNDQESRSSYDWVVAGTVADEPEIVVTESGVFDIADGDVRAGGTLVNNAPWKARTVVYDVTNAGSADLTITGLTVAPTGATIVSSTWDVAPPIVAGVTRQLSITYYPSLASPPGPYSFDVSFTTNDTDETNYNWTVSGSATVPQPDVTVRSVLNARDIPKGGLDVYTSLPEAVLTTLDYTLKNEGDADLLVTGVTLTSSSGCVAALTPPAGLPATVVRGASITYTLDITPTSSSVVWKANVNVASNSAGEASFGYLATSYSASGGGGEGRSCGFGSPFGLLLVAGLGLLFTRRRSV
jgi:hypothetical protein